MPPVLVDSPRVTSHHEDEAIRWRSGGTGPSDNQKPRVQEADGGAGDVSDWRSVSRREWPCCFESV